MFQKTSSILDYPFPGLATDVWEKDGKLKEEHKDLILTSLARLLDEAGFEHSDEWIDKIAIIGSITTYQYVRTSDIDLHIFTDLDKFVKLERSDMSKEEAHEYLDALRKLWNETEFTLANTKHPVEWYFDSEFSTVETKRNTGVYNVAEDNWDKEPIAVNADFDIEEMKPFIVDMANEIAEGFDASIGDIKRHIIRIEELQEVLPLWPKSQQDIFQKKIDERVAAIEDEIDAMVSVREEIVEDRKDKYGPASEEEIKFKYLQRFGYLYLVGQFKDLLEKVTEVTEETIPTVKEIVTEAALPSRLWIAPDGTEFNAGGHHGAWIANAGKAILLKYGIKFTTIGETFSQMMAKGWVRASTEHNGFQLECQSLSSIPSFVDDLVAKYFDQGSSIEIGDQAGRHAHLTDPFPSIQRAVNKALRGAPANTAPVPVTIGALAEKKEWPGAHKLCIDFDGTIATHKDDVFTLLPGAAEALEQFKKDGWEIVIYSVRANDDKGLDLIKSFLEENSVPFDEIYVGKPAAEYYIDDNAIAFNNWKDVLPKVKKQASLVIRAYLEHGYWIDPNGKVYTVRDANSTDSTHMQWVDENKQMLMKKYKFNVDDYDDRWAAVEGLVEAGWVRIGDGMNTGGTTHAILVKDLKHISTKVDDLVFQFYQQGQPLEVTDLQHNFVVIREPLPSIEKAVREAIRMGGLQNNHEEDEYTNEDEQSVTHTHELSPAEPEPKAPHKHRPVLQPGQQMPDGTYRQVQVCQDCGEEVGPPVFGQPPQQAPKRKRAPVNKPGDPVQQSLPMAASLSAEADYTHAYWIDPNGKAFQVRGEDGNVGADGYGPSDTHGGWILKHLDMLQKDYGIDPKSFSGTTSSLVEMGWVRIGDAFGTDWGITVKNLNNIPSSVDDLLAQFAPEGSIITVATPSNYGYTANFEWPVNSVQQTVRKILQVRQRVQQPVAASLKTAQNNAKYDYSSTHVNLPKDIAAKVIAWGHQHIPNEHIYDDETNRYGRELESHVTVKYGLTTDDAKEVKAFLEKHAPVNLKFGKTAFFSPPNGQHDVVVIEVISDDLNALNEAVCEAFETEDLYDGYKPHVTVAYVHPGHGKIYAGKDVMDEDENILIDEVIFSPVKGEKVACKLMGNVKEAEFTPSFATPAVDGVDPVDPDTMSDEETLIAPCITDKKDRPSFWDKFLSMFRSDDKKDPAKLLSKQDNYSKSIKQAAGMTSQDAKKLLMDPMSKLVDISAQRSDLTQEENAKRHQQLIQILRDGGFQIIGTGSRGFYGGSAEDSVKVRFDSEEQLEALMELGKTFQQDAIQIKMMTKVFWQPLKQGVEIPEPIDYREVNWGKPENGQNYTDTSFEEGESLPHSYRLFDPNAKRPAGYKAPEQKKQEGPYAVFIGTQNDAKGKPFNFYNIFNVPGKQDGTSVAEETIKELGIPVLKEAALKLIADRLIFPVDPQCPTVRQYVENLETATLPMNMPRAEVLRNWEIGHLKDCPTCKAYSQRYATTLRDDAKKPYAWASKTAAGPQSPLKLTRSRGEELAIIRDELMRGAPGFRYPVVGPDGYFERFEGQPSTYPEYFQNKGYTSKEVISLIDRALSYRPMTQRQVGILTDVLDTRRAPRLHDIREERSRRGPAEEGDTSFPFGENVEKKVATSESEEMWGFPAFTTETNDENLGQPGVRRYMGKPDDEDSSNQGDVDDILIKDLIQQKKRRPVSRLEMRASWIGGWISPKGVLNSSDDHETFIRENPDLFDLSEEDLSELTDSAIFDRAYKMGWVYVRISTLTIGTILLVQAASLEQAHLAEDFIYEHLNDFKRIDIVTGDLWWEASAEEFKENGWSSIQRSTQGKIAAQVENVDGLRVYKNPSQDELTRLSKSFHKEFMSLPYIRALIDNKTGDIYAWDGWFENHDAMMEKLGLEDADHWYGDSEDVPHLYALQEDLRRSRFEGKTAGSESNTYTDEAMEQIYDEQHEQNDSPDGNPHDWISDTRQFPKQPRRPDLVRPNELEHIDLDEKGAPAGEDAPM